MLALPGGLFSRRINNFGATPSTAGPGTAVLSGSGGAKGSVVSLLSALAFDGQRVLLSFSGYSASSANGSAVADVVIDPAGGTAWNTTTPLLANLLCGHTGAAAAGAASLYEFPVLIPAGASVGCRVAAGTAWTGRVGIWVFGNPRDPSAWWAGDKVVTLGVSGVTGTTVSPGSSGTYGSWANIGSATTDEIKALGIGIQATSGTTVNALAYHVQIGAGSTQLGEEIYAVTTAAEMMSVTGPTCQYLGGPAGTQFQARATCSGTAQNIQVALYGVCG